jgi:hypothetical protein
MPKDELKYGASHVPEAKPKEIAKRGAPKSSGKTDEIEEAIRELRDEMKKSNRDNLDSMYNIDEDNLSASYRKKIDGRFIAAYSAIQTWADSQSAGFQAVAKWQSEVNNKLSNTVTQTNLNASIKSYIEGDEGKAGIDSVVSGSYVKIDKNTGIATTSDVVSKISQGVSDGIGKLTLSVSNGKDSSTIQLMNGTTSISSKTIKFTGDVVFKSDLSTAGATTINGANITTGKISAALVDTSDLVVENVWLKSEIIPNTKVLTSELLSANNLTVRLGVQQNNGWAQYLEVYGTAIYFGRPGYIPSSDSNALMFDMANRSIFPAMTRTWSIGSENAKFLNAYVETACVDEILFKSGGAYESSLYVTSSGDLRFIDRDGLSHTIVDI